MAKYKLIRYLYRNVAVKKETLIKLIEKLDADKDGRVTLGEVAKALKILWCSAMGKVKAPKPPKIKTVD